MSPFHLVFLVFWGVLFPCDGFIAYDCTQSSINYTTIDLTHVDKCKEPDTASKRSTSQIQLVQLTSTIPVFVQQCKVEIQRHVAHCGMHSHSSEVLGGVASYIMELSMAQCLDVHMNKAFKLQYNIIIDDLKMNATNSRLIMLAGSLTSDASCKGAYYSDRFGSWSDVTVQGTIKITLTSYMASADIDKDSIHLRSGLSCRYSRSGCMDTENGNTYWTAHTIGTCDHERYTVLYEGPAQKIISNYGHMMNATVYMASTKERAFALARTERFEDCLLTAWRTEHPKLLIVEWDDIPFILKKKPLAVETLDLMTYMNAKFVLVDRNNRDTFEQIYKYLSYRRCMVEYNMIRTQLSIASFNPKEFAYLYADGPGYTALNIGEVVYIIKCIPVEVTLRKTDECFNELPIYYRNQSYFMTAKNRLIQKHGNQVGCNDFTPPMYMLNGGWYAIRNGARVASAPSLMAPYKDEEWRFMSPGSLATAGIYDENDLERLRMHIMAPNEREAVETILTTHLLAGNANMQGIDTSTLLSGKGLENVVNQTISKLWGWFSIFGNISAGVLGVYMLLRVIKFMVDTVIHGTMLYEAYGLSIALFGSIWDSVTHCLIKYKEKKSSEERTDVENPREEVSLIDRPASAPIEATNVITGPYHNVRKDMGFTV